MDPALSAAQFGGSLSAGPTSSSSLNGPLGSSGMPGAIGNSSAGLSGSFAGGMGASSTGF